MFIKPMTRIDSIQAIGEIQKKESTTPFQDIFQKAAENVIETDREFQRQQYLLATGQTDDLHSLTIASTKAQLSVDMMIQLRNRALESYNELMRINL